MNTEIIGRLAVCGIAISLMVAVSELSMAEEHVNPNCCKYPARPSGVKIQFFLEACAVPGETARGMIPYFDCQSYVLGVIDTYRQLKYSVPKSISMCIPPDVTTKDVLELVWKQYPNWSVHESRQASEIILEVLNVRFPCNK
jgi:hypothetical protein